MGGHDPEEDARACVDLLKLKLEYGPGFGEFKVDYESIFERMGRCAARDAMGGRTGGVGGAERIKSAVVDHGNPGVMHGAKATSAIGCKTDDEVLEGLLGVIPTHQFTYGRFLGLANALGCKRSFGLTTWTFELFFFFPYIGITPKAPSDTTVPLQTTVDPPLSPAELAPILSNLNHHLQALHDALPPRTALVIFTGHSDPRKMSLLNARKNAFESAIKSGKGIDEVVKEMGLSWTTADSRELEDAVELARRGLVFLGIKQ